MEKTVKIFAPLMVIAALLAILLASLVVVLQPKSSLGSVNVSNEYKYSMFSGPVASTTLLAYGPSTLGSIVITSSTTSTIDVYDCATTTAALVSSSTYSTRIARFGPSQPAGVYTFDIQANRGIVVSSSVTTINGNITFTYR